MLVSYQQVERRHLVPNLEEFSNEALLWVQHEN